MPKIPVPRVRRARARRTCTRSTTGIATTVRRGRAARPVAIETTETESTECSVSPRPPASPDHDASATSIKAVMDSSSGLHPDRIDRESADLGTPIEEKRAKGFAERLVAEYRASYCVREVGENQRECAKNALAMRKYMRNQFEFFGIKTPKRRLMQDSFFKAHEEELKNRETLLKFVPLLWDEERREMHHFAVDLLRKVRVQLLGESPQHFREALGCVEGLLLSNKSWWDTVDALAYQVVGYFVHQRPELGLPVMKRWIAHENMWLRRAAILHQLCLKGSMDVGTLFGFCKERAFEEEFFVRKAIGWALRDYARTDERAARAVRSFVEENRAVLSPLSIREALKHIG